MAAERAVMATAAVYKYSKAQHNEMGQGEACMNCHCVKCCRVALDFAALS
jgi:hypothetical protein